jgi:hypothetical protein
MRNMGDNGLPLTGKKTGEGGLDKSLGTHLVRGPSGPGANRWWHEIVKAWETIAEGEHMASEVHMGWAAVRCFTWIGWSGQRCPRGAANGGSDLGGTDAGAVDELQKVDLM